jgi:DMSO/TMAO reductase YedYZ molybdopterin-dependent catalytic subunit
MTQAKFFTSVFISILLILPLTAVLFLAESIADMPFPAFDVMDFMVRTLPGDVVTKGIDTMVDLITEVKGAEDLDKTAKRVEQASAVAQFIGLGVVVGLIYIALVHYLHRRNSFWGTQYATGLILGLLVGIVLAVISAEYNVSATASTFAATVWILVASMGWGLAHNWVQRKLLPSESAPEPMSPVAETPAAPKPQVELIDRRQFLVRMGGATAVITVAGAGLAELLRESETIKGGNIEIAGLSEGLVPAPGTRAEYTPLEDHYRIDINSGRPPTVSEADYRLPITGLVNTPLELSLADLRNNYEPLLQFVTLSCISNRIGGRLISTTRWTGVPMKRILADAGLKPEATHLKISSFDGFFEIVALDVIEADERVMLTYEWDGVPLPDIHGYPLRIYIPDRYGMKQPKWIEKMEVTDHWEEGYWVRRGWSKEALVRTTSVIDTVAVNDVVEVNGQSLIPVGGIAYSGAKGISKVEVKVDNGEWQPAQLRTPLSETTWVIWRYDWAMVEGEHTFSVRAYDNSGTLQIEEVMPNRPDGATGIHSLEASV